MVSSMSDFNLCMRTPLDLCKANAASVWLLHNWTVYLSRIATLSTIFIFIKSSVLNTRKRIAWLKANISQLHVYWVQMHDQISRYTVCPIQVIELKQDTTCTWFWNCKYCKRTPSDWIVEDTSCAKSSRVIVYHIVSYHHTKQQNTINSQHIVSYRIIVSHYMASFHTTPYHLSLNLQLIIWTAIFCSGRNLGHKKFIHSLMAGV